jgi:hypothetical protein
MTKEEIIEVAKKVGWGYSEFVFDKQRLLDFAKLIAEKEREHLIQIGLIGVLKHCEDLLREDGHEDAMNNVQEMISKIRARG